MGSENMGTFAGVQVRSVETPIRPTTTQERLDLGNNQVKQETIQTPGGVKMSLDENTWESWYPGQELQYTIFLQELTSNLRALKSGTLRRGLDVMGEGVKAEITPWIDSLELNAKTLLGVVVDTAVKSNFEAKFGTPKEDTLEFGSGFIYSVLRKVTEMGMEQADRETGKLISQIQQTITYFTKYERQVKLKIEAVAKQIQEAKSFASKQNGITVDQAPHISQKSTIDNKTDTRIQALEREYQQLTEAQQVAQFQLYMYSTYLQQFDARGFDQVENVVPEMVAVSTN